MKGIICYYSGSGNTLLACRYIAGRIRKIPFELFDITKDRTPDLTAYDIVGFAAFTDFLGPSFLFHRFAQGLPQHNGRLAFVFNTYGYISGKTLREMERLVSRRGFRVVIGHSLHTPESYPPMVAGGRGNEQAPTLRELKAFEAFIEELDRVVEEVAAGVVVKKRGAPVSLLSRVLPVFARTKARKDMGVKFVDEALCTECGVCARLCPYGAVALNPRPVFDMNKCYGCWRCFNLCPEKAIYTKKFRGIGHYPKPPEKLKDKLKL